MQSCLSLEYLQERYFHNDNSKLFSWVPVTFLSNYCRLGKSNECSTECTHPAISGHIGTTEGGKEIITMQQLTYR